MDKKNSIPGNLDVLFTQKLIESSLDGVIIISSDSKVTHWNNQAVNIFGYTQDEAIGSFLHDLIMPKQFIDAHQTGIDHYMNTGEHNILNQRIEIVGRRKNGQEFPVELTVSPIKTGKKMYFSAFVRDLTEQKKLTGRLEDAVSTLEENEKYLKSLNEFAVKILDKNTMEELVWEVANMVIKEIGFKDCVIYLFDENREYLLQKAAYGPKISNPKTIKNPIRIKLGDGIVGTVAKTGKAELVNDTSKDSRYLIDDDLRYSELAVPIITNGEIIGVIDSEHKEKDFYTKEHLDKLQTVSGLVSARLNNIQNQEKLAVFSTAIEQNPVSVIITDTNGKIEYVNPQFSKTTGYSLEEVKGETPRIVRSGKHDAEFYKEMWDTIKDGRTWRGELCNKRKDGELYWEASFISPIMNTDGVTTHFISVQENITETRRMNDELIQARMEAEEASMAKSRFLANMSHEIRTPLMGIKGAIELLSSTRLNKEQLANLNRLETSTEGLIDTINDILDFSKIESGQMELENTPFFVYDMVHGVFQSMEAAADRKGLQLEMLFDDKIEEGYLGDPVRLRQVLINLTGNAIKFTQSGMVEINCSLIEDDDEKSLIEFSIRDTGIGIDAENLNLIFESFKQEDDSTNRRYGGTGLGLAISRQIVRLMNSDIHVKSAKGLGSKFFFEIEMKKTHMIEQAEDDIQEPDLTGIKLLLVEDNKLIQETNKALIKQWGVIVETANDGQDAVNKVRDNVYDMILMDKNMPGMDGFQATQIIRTELKNTTPIIALTADVVKGVIDKSIESGMNDYISKPFKTKQLIRKIYDLLPAEKQKLVDKKAAKSELEEDLASEQYNLDVLRSVTENDEDQVNYLIKQFIVSTEEYLEQLMTFKKEEDVKGVRHISHALKSSFKYLNLKKLSEVATRLEARCDSNESFEQLIPDMDIVLDGIQNVLVQLKEDFGEE